MDTIIYLSNYALCAKYLDKFTQYNKIQIVMNDDSNNISKKHFNQTIVVNSYDITEYEKIIHEISELHNIKALIVPDEDYITIGGHLRSKFNIPGLQREQSILARDKSLMKDVIRVNGIKTCFSKIARKTTDFFDFCDKYDYPIIVKPIDGAGSANTYKLSNVEDLNNYLSNHVEDIIPVQLEQFIIGREFHCDSIVKEGQVIFSSVGEYLFNCLDVVQNEMPCSSIVYPEKDKNEPLVERIKEMNTKVINALGIDNSVCHAEMFLSPDGQLYFGEIGARVGGGQVLPPCIKNTHGVDLLSALVDLELDSLSLDIKTNSSVYTGMICFRTKEGIVKEISSVEDFTGTKGLVSVRIFYKPEDHMESMNDTMTRSGFIILEDDNYEALRKRLISVYNSFHLQVF